MAKLLTLLECLQDAQSEQLIRLRDEMGKQLYLGEYESVPFEYINKYASYIYAKSGILEIILM